jgi:hypothetical protein
MNYRRDVKNESVFIFVGMDSVNPASEVGIAVKKMRPVDKWKHLTNIINKELFLFVIVNLNI